MLSSTSGSHLHHWVGAVWLANQIFDWTSYWTGAPNNVAVSVFRFDLEIKCPFKFLQKQRNRWQTAAGSKTVRLWGFLCWSRDSQEFVILNSSPHKLDRFGFHWLLQVSLFTNNWRMYVVKINAVHSNSVIFQDLLILRVFIFFQL